jgi:hypothetical protein
MPRRLVIAGVAVTGVGLILLGYLDPVIRVLFFGPSALGAGGGFAGGATSFTRTGVFTGNFTGGFTTLSGRGAAAGTTSLVSVATIIVFVATVIGLLLTIAGSFATGKAMPTVAGPAPAAKDANPSQDSSPSRTPPTAT